MGSSTHVVVIASDVQTSLGKGDPTTMTTSEWVEPQQSHDEALG